MQKLLSLEASNPINFKLTDLEQCMGPHPIAEKITERTIQNEPEGHVFDTSRLELSCSGDLRISSLFREYESLHDIAWTRQTSA